MDEKTISLIAAILSKGDRVELIPVKDGVKIIRIERKKSKYKAPGGKRSAGRPERG